MIQGQAGCLECRRKPQRRRFFCCFAGAIVITSTNIKHQNHPAIIEISPAFTVGAPGVFFQIGYRGSDFSEHGKCHDMTSWLCMRGDSFLMRVNLLSQNASMPEVECRRSIKLTLWESANQHRKQHHQKNFQRHL
ncbi:hypothetical protein AWM69_12495 [Pseudomonas sp. D1HM]|nr:hypothetical protein [Pseudomonas sp. D1HM]